MSDVNLRMVANRKRLAKARAVARLKEYDKQQTEKGHLEKILSLFEGVDTGRTRIMDFIPHPSISEAYDASR